MLFKIQLSYNGRHKALIAYPAAGPELVLYCSASEPIGELEAINTTRYGVKLGRGVYLAARLSVTDDACKPTAQQIAQLQLQINIYFPTGFKAIPDSSPRPGTIPIVLSCIGEPTIFTGTTHCSKLELPLALDNVLFYSVRQLLKCAMCNVRVCLSKIATHRPTPLAITTDTTLSNHLESDAVSDLTPGIWNHVRLKSSKIAKLFILCFFDDLFEISSDENGSIFKSETALDSKHCSKITVNWSLTHDSHC
ncbi:hypothetical protein J6590_092748 [Homalodisca vitripennis]|nr:hypothetical protein J6590_092748 [Homalodisca vitripennis]